MTMDEETCRRIVRQTVQEIMQGVGFDMSEPHKLQADIHYLRKLRNGSEDMVRVVRRSALTLGCSTALFLLWEAIKAASGGK